ncbi:hypothetical protein BC833DRAFT_604640 [Globomyces pollinis-pini]|nr:hypothetical protein BC833DRAFT_604640 [Globomyces pollinis-pini]
MFRKWAMLPFVFGSVVVQIQYRNSFNCVGSPNVMYIFNVTDLNSPKPNINESWPVFYSFTLTECSVFICSSLEVPLKDNCCISSLDLSLSEQYQSGTAAELKEVNPLQMYANDGTYCVITKTTLHHNSSNFRYNEMFILNDNHCVEHFKCLQNKTLMIYDQNQCQGSFELFSLKATPILINSRGLSGSVQVSYQTGTNDTNKISWIASIPSTNSIPNTNSIWDIIQHLCFSVILISDLALIVYVYFYLYRVTQTNYMKLLMLLSIIWLVSDTLNCVYAYSVISSIQQQYQIIQTLWTFHNLATLLNVFQTTFFIFNIVIPNEFNLLKAIIIISIVILQLVLAGSKYIGYCWQPYVTFCTTYFPNYLDWIGYVQYWILFVFIWDIVPITIIFYKFFNSLNFRTTSVWQSIYVAWLYDIVLPLIVLLQVFIAVTYFAVSFIQHYTDWLGSDKAWDSLLAVQTLLITSHMILNVVAIQRLRYLISMKVNADLIQETEQDTQYSTTQNTTFTPDTPPNSGFSNSHHQTTCNTHPKGPPSSPITPED